MPQNTSTRWCFWGVLRSVDGGVLVTIGSQAPHQIETRSSQLPSLKPSAGAPAWLLLPVAAAERAELVHCFGCCEDHDVEVKCPPKTNIESGGVTGNHLDSTRFDSYKNAEGSHLVLAHLQVWNSGGEAE